MFGTTLPLVLQAVDTDDLEDEDLYDLNDASEKLGYITEQMTDIQSLNVINIFALGVLAGLVMGSIMWRVVND